MAHGRKSARRVNFVDPENHALKRPTSARDEKIKFQQSARLNGGVSLSKSQEADLLLEVSKRTAISSKDISTYGFVDPLNALLESIRADKDRWYASLELQNDLTFEKDVVLVLVSEVTRGKSMQTEVEGVIASGAKFTSESVRLAKGSASLAKGNVKFEIVDTDFIDFSSTSPNGTILFARLIPYVASAGPNGVRFRTVKDKNAMTEIATVLSSGI